MRLLPPFLAACVAFLSLLQGSARAQASDTAFADDQPATEEEVMTQAEAEAEAEARPRRINAPSHDAGLGYRSIRFRTEDGGVYQLHALPLTFDYWVGRKWGLMLHGEAYFPMRGAQPRGGEDYRGSIRQDYSQRWGLDGSIMVGLHQDIAEDLHLYAGVGVHLQSFRINDAEFSTIEAVTMGVGAVARLRYDFHRHMHVTGLVAAAIDPIDLIKHRNRVIVLFPLTFGVSLGTHF